MERCVIDGRLISDGAPVYENGSAFCQRHFREMQEDRSELGMAEGRGTGRVIAEIGPCRAALRDVIAISEELGLYDNDPDH